MSRVLLILAATFIVTGCAARVPQQHPDFAQRQKTVQTVVVIPADVLFYQDTVTDGAQRDSARENFIQSELQYETERVLRARGYTVNTDLANRIARGDKSLAFEMEQFRQRYVSLLDETNRGKKGDSTPSLVQASVGPQATAWAAKARADAMLFVRYEGFERSVGKTVVDSIPGLVLGAATGIGYMALKSAAQLEAAMIDAVSGEIIWVSDAKDKKGNPVFRGKRMVPRKMLDYALRPLPRAVGYVSPTDKPALVAASTPDNRDAPSATDADNEPDDVSDKGDD